MGSRDLALAIPGIGLAADGVWHYEQSPVLSWRLTGWQ